MTPLQKFRKSQLRNLPTETGVYALCDLNQVPIYVGQSTDGIRQRVLRHLTSARSDVVANRMIDVWEVAFVWAWPVKGAANIAQLEGVLYHKFNRKNRLMNGSVPLKRSGMEVAERDTRKVQILPDEEIASRKRPEHRLPRQIAQFNQLMDYILIVKDAAHLREALQAHFERLSAYYKAFTASKSDPDAEL